MKNTIPKKKHKYKLTKKSSNNNRYNSFAPVLVNDFYTSNKKPTIKIGQSVFFGDTTQDPRNWVMTSPVKAIRRKEGKIEFDTMNSTYVLSEIV